VIPSQYFFLTVWVKVPQHDQIGISLNSRFWCKLSVMETRRCCIAVGMSLFIDRSQSSSAFTSSRTLMESCNRKTLWIITASVYKLPKRMVCLPGLDTLL